MPRVAVTGHVVLTREASTVMPSAVAAGLRRLGGPGVHGITCMACGADQIFARAVLTMPGTFEVVLPARDYEQAMWDQGQGEAFTELLGHAEAVQVLPFEHSSRIAYLAASCTMLSRCDVLMAIWDGRSSRRIGDTAHVVSLARAKGLPVEVVWPATAAGG